MRKRNGRSTCGECGRLSEPWKSIRSQKTARSATDLLAVRASLTDDGRSPLEASGLRLYSRIEQISDSIGRVQEKKDYLHPVSAVAPVADQRAPGDRAALAAA